MSNIVLNSDFVICQSFCGVKAFRAVYTSLLLFAGDSERAARVEDSTMHFQLEEQQSEFFLVIGQHLRENFCLAVVNLG